MREQSPFFKSDLWDLRKQLLERAATVVPMELIHDRYYIDRTVIGMRHDVDNFIEPAVKMAKWEDKHGFRSTYFILHTAPYWQDKQLLQTSLERIAECGHEIGFHVNAITEALRTGRDPLAIVAEAVGELRGYGYPVRGVVAHGDKACYEHHFVNDEIFTESARPDWGEPDRTIGGWLRLAPVPRATFGFDYDPNWLPRAKYLSDSGGQWSTPFDEVAAGFPYDGQLHMLIHPDWWAQAFTPAEVAA